MRWSLLQPAITGQAGTPAVELRDRIVHALRPGLRRLARGPIERLRPARRSAIER